MGLASILLELLLLPITLLLTTLRLGANILLFIFSPALLVAYYISYVLSPLMIPLQFLRQLESLYLFCGTAAIIGISVGCFLGLVNSLLFNALRLTPPPSSLNNSRNGLTSSESEFGGGGARRMSGVRLLREERRRRRAEKGKDIARDMVWDGGGAGAGGSSSSGSRLEGAEPVDRRKAFVSTPVPGRPKSIPTILEEEEDEDYYYQSSTPHEGARGSLRSVLRRRRSRPEYSDDDYYYQGL